MNAGRSYNRVCGALVIDRLAAQAEQEVPALAALLCDATNGGAWVSFLPPLEEATADVYRREVLASVARGTRVLLVARLGCEHASRRAPEVGVGSILGDLCAGHCDL